MDSDLILILVASIFGLFIAFLLFAWLFRVVAAWLCIYSNFVLELPYIITIPVFIIFPPAFVAVLAGLVFLAVGEVDEEGVWKSTSRLSKIRNREKERRKKCRQELGYDDE